MLDVLSGLRPKLPMKILLPIMLLVAASAITFLMARSEKSEESETEPVALRKVVSVITETTITSLMLESQGFVSSRSQAVISAEVGGRVVDIAEEFYAGEFIQAGDLLLKIEDFNYKAEVKAHEAQVAAAQLRLAEEEARAAQARLDWEAMGTEPASPLTLRTPQLAEAKASLGAAKASLARAKRNLERTEIRAPFDALVIERNTELGSVLGGGSPVAVLAAVDYAEIRLPILNDDVPFVNLEPGTPVLLTQTSSLGIMQWNGTISRSENVIDRTSRSLYAVVRVEYPYGRITKDKQSTHPLRFGAFVTASIPSIPIEDVIQLPRVAMRGQHEVALINEEDLIQIREVEVLYANADHVFISQGLGEGERVCITAPQSFYQGTQVVWKDQAGE